MLQFKTCHSDRFTAVELATKAIEGGCKWIELEAEAATPEARRETIRTCAEQLIPLCKEAGVYLLLDNEPDVALELACHGVLLPYDPANISAVRERLGAEAIIGVTVSTASQLPALRGKDIDYLSVDSEDPSVVSAIKLAAMKAGIDIPVVAAGRGVDKENARALINAGADGVAASRSIADTDDPVLYTAELLRALA